MSTDRTTSTGPRRETRRGASSRARRSAARSPASGRVRPASPEDAAALIALQREYYREDGLEHATANARALRLLLRRPEAGAVWVIETAGGGGIVGYIALTLGYSLELGGRDAFVDELYVRPEHRGRGLGALALEALLAGAGRRGVRAVHLEVDAGNEGARRLYLRAGFRLRGRYQLMTRRL